MNKTIIPGGFDRLLEQLLGRSRIAPYVSDLRRDQSMFTGKILRTILRPELQFFLVRRQCPQNLVAFGIRTRIQ
jgi:hypothetical protein